MPSLYDAYQQKGSTPPPVLPEQPQKEGVFKRIVRAALPKAIEEKVVGPKPVPAQPVQKPSLYQAYTKQPVIPSPTAKPLTPLKPDEQKLQEETFKGAAQEQLTKIEERMKLIESGKSEMEQKETGEFMTPSPVFGPPSATRSQTFEEKKKGDELKNLRVAADAYKDFLVGGKDEGFLKDVAAGIQDGIQDPSKLVPFLGSLESFGELKDIYSAIKKVEKGEDVSSYEKSLLQKFQAKNLPKDRGLGYLVGNTMSQLPTYAAEFFLTGGVFKLGAKATEKVISKFLPKFVANRAGNIATKVASTAIGSTLQATANVPKIAEKTAAYMIPNYAVFENKEGELISQIDKSGDDFNTALAKAFGTQAVEYFTERAGVVVEKPIAFIQRAVFGKYVAKHGVSKLAQKIKEGIAWNGIIGEVFEEELAELGQAPIESRDYKAPFLTPEGNERLFVETLAIAGFGGLGKISDVALRAGGAPTLPPEEKEKPKGLYDTFVQTQVAKETAKIEPTALELQKEAEARGITPTEPPVETLKQAPVEAKEGISGTERVTEFLDEIEGIKAEVPAEVRKQADQDWETKFAPSFNKITEQIDQLTTQIQNARREQRDELLKQRGDWEEQLVEVERQFIEKWRTKITGERKPEEEFKEKFEEPQKFFHGTTKEAAAQIKKAGLQPSTDQTATFGRGIYLTPNLEVAQEYAKETAIARRKVGSEVIEVRAKQPLRLYRVTADERADLVDLIGKEQDVFIKKMLGDKYDGFIIKDSRGDDEVIIYNPDLIEVVTEQAEAKPAEKLPAGAIEVTTIKPRFEKKPSPQEVDTMLREIHAKRTKVEERPGQLSSQLKSDIWTLNKKAKDEIASEAPERKRGQLKPDETSFDKFRKEVSPRFSKQIYELYKEKYGEYPIGFISLSDSPFEWSHEKPGSVVYDVGQAETDPTETFISGIDIMGVEDILTTLHDLKPRGRSSEIIQSDIQYEVERTRPKEGEPKAEKKLSKADEFKTILKSALKRDDKKFIENMQDRVAKNPDLRLALEQGLMEARREIEAEKPKVTEQEIDEFLAKEKAKKIEAKPTQRAKPKSIVAIAKKAISTKGTLPILGEVRVRDGLLEATNLDVGIRLKTDLKDGMYQIVGNEFVATKTDPEEFPIIPEAKEQVLQFSPDAISNAITEAAKHAAKPDGSRPELSGVHIKNVNGRVRITTTDSFRLLSKEVGSKILKSTEFIMAEPKKVSQILSSLTGKITVKESAEHIEFEGDNGSVVARKIDAKYPDFEKVYPQFKEQFRVSRESLKNALKELKPFTNSLSEVQITPMQTGLKLYAKKEDGVEKTIEIEATKTEIKNVKAQYIPGALVMPIRADGAGKGASENTLSLNINYVSEVLNSFEDGQFYMSLTGEKNNPIHFSDQNEFEYLEETQKAPAYKGGKKGAAIGTFGDTPVELGHLQELRPIELPELVQLATEISKTPSVVKFPRFPQVVIGEFGEVVSATMAPKQLGQAQGGQIKLDTSLFKKENIGQAAKVLAHEIGHVVDWLPDKISNRGNILGRLFTLRDFLKSTYGSEGALDLKKIRNDVTKEVLKETGHTFGEMVTGKLPPEIKTQIKERIGAYVTEHAITKKEIQKELYELSKYWRPFDEATSDGGYLNYRKSSSELYADAVSAMFNSPGTVERMAPMFYEGFFDSLDRKPEVKKAYFELQALLSGDRTVLVKHRVMGVRGMFEDGDYKSLELQKKREAEKQKRASDLWFALKFDVVAKNQAVLDKVRETEAKGIYVNPDDNPIYYLRESNYLGGKIKAILEMKFQSIYNELQENGISWVDFGEGLFYERIIAGDRSEIANPRGLTPEAVNELYDDLQARVGDKYSVLQKGMAEFRAALREISEEAYTEGLYTDELYKQMQENPAYVTFRVLEHLEDVVSSRVFKQMGTLKDIDNPANASILKMIATVRAIEANKTRKSLVKFMNEYHPSEIEPAKTRYIGKGRTEPMKPKDRTKQELITLLEGGKFKGYYVDPYIAKAFEKTPTAQLNAAIKVLRFFNSRFFRPLFITFNLGFQSFNLIRDFARFWKNIPGMTMLQALKRYKQAFRPARRRAFGLPDNPTKEDIEANDMILKLEKEQVLSVTFNDVILGHQELDTQIDAIMAQAGLDGHRPAKNPVFSKILDILEWIKQTGDMIETLPKVAGYYELSQRQNTNPREMRDFIRRKIGSPDFLDGGYGKPVWNEVFLFSNAIIQGIRADVEVATDPQTRAGWWMKTALIKFVPQTLMFAALLGMYGDDLREMMEDVSEYDKTNYIIIPLGRDQNGKTIYMRVPADESSRFLGGIYWKVLRMASGEKDVWRSVGDVASYTGGQLPSLSPSIGNAFAMGQFIAGENPYDFFRGRPVLTDDQYRAGGLNAFKPFVGWMWEQMGGGIFYKTFAGESVPPNLSPGERFLRLPILSNVVGRFFRISDYGQSEKLRAVGEVVKKEDATRRLNEKKIVNKYVERFNETPNAILKVRTFENEMVKEVLGKNPMTKEEYQTKDRLEKAFRIARNKSIRDPRVTSLIYAVTNDEKVAIIKEIKSGISEKEWNELRTFLQKEKIISSQVLLMLTKAEKAKK